MNQQESDFYRKLRKKVVDWLATRQGQSSEWAEYLVLAPDMFHLLCKLAADPAVPRGDKARLLAVIAYFISPLDLLPEAVLGPAGYIDDIAIAAYVLNRVINNTDPEIVRRHWAGSEDVLEVVRKILDRADKMVGSGLWQKLKRIVG